MPEPLKFFKIDDATIYHDGFSYSLYRDLDPPKSSSHLQLHQSFHCALRDEQDCRSRICVTGNWEMDKKGRKFMLGIVKKGNHTHRPEFRDTTPKLRFYKSDDDGSLYRNGFDYSLYRELDPPKQIADFQWHQAYRCSMSDQENCRARIYTTGQWEKNKRELEYQLGIFKNCIHNHGLDQDSNEEDKENNHENQIATTTSSTHTKDREKREQIRFYKYKQTCVQHNGFVYHFHSEISQGNWKHRMFCQRQFNGKKTCNGYIWTTGKWDKDDRGREYQIGIVMAQHDHEPHQIAFQGKDNDNESPHAGLKFYIIDKKVHRDGHVYCFHFTLKSHPPWKHRMRCTQNSKTVPCKGAIWTTGEWETDNRGRLYQRGIPRGGHSHVAYEQFFNEDDTAFVGSGDPPDDKSKIRAVYMCYIGNLGYTVKKSSFKCRLQIQCRPTEQLFCLSF
ncbi:hypothetical protein DdX_16999 [Ditylenchus destructor]|uniref:Uncharacterized protein n=1 Tax=Ditylenchus destructor TaxID=166010 RepID=A0AAD4MPE4_9BILA|nr:hypothetical protein DdX_16999 [Ditylenchus destructor]